MPQRAPCADSQAAAVGVPTSRARPRTCVDSAGGSTHLRAARAEPYVRTALSYIRCCLAHVRYPEFTTRENPALRAADRAAANAFASRGSSPRADGAGTSVALAAAPYVRSPPKRMVNCWSGL